MQGVEMARSRREDSGGEHAGGVHLPVLPVQVVQLLGGSAGSDLEGWLVDATLGAGGHAALCLNAFPRIRLLGVDQDPEILRHACKALRPFGSRVRIRRGRLSSIGRLLEEEGASRVAGWLLDLGASSLQLESAERGFSFRADGPLDMRMDPDRQRTAADIVNSWDESDLADLFYYEGGEARSRRIARAIVEARRRAPFLRTGALADVIARAAGRQPGGGARIHPATKVFQALRRAVNEEGEELLAGLAQAEQWLVDGGRLVAISFHSGEDGAVKRFLVQGAAAGRWRVLTKKPIRAAREELSTNRRARSASLRAAERTRTAGRGHWE
jgi:16S rRNA (cytosine1402-N4)-methyltransferase